MQCPNCGVLMIEVRYPDNHKFGHEGTSEFHCETCKARYGAFCCQPLKENEVETVNCKGLKNHPVYIEL